MNTAYSPFGALITSRSILPGIAWYHGTRGGGWRVDARTAATHLTASCKEHATVSPGYFWFPSTHAARPLDGPALLVCWEMRRALRVVGWHAEHPHAILRAKIKQSLPGYVG
jgi:hypothetical protein